jgi:phosphate transport system substrate-binding protein
MPVVAFGMTGSEQDFFSGRTGVAPAPHVTAQARASALLRVLAETPGGIGYAPAGYRGESVRAVPVSDGGECVAPTEANAHRAAYPLARVVSLHARGAAARDFAGYVLSQEGQRDAVIAGHFSLPYVFAAEARTALGLD